MEYRACCGIEALFNKKTAARELRQYRKKGPLKSTRSLIEALGSEGVIGMTLLDIGGGIGAIQHQLLSSGVNSATNVDASTAYLEAAKEEAERQGLAGRVTYHHGDFVVLAPTIAPADIVTLDRVICCYPNMEALVQHSAARARRLYGVVLPRDTWWVKVGFAVMNSWMWASRNPFRGFVHPTSFVEAEIHKNGFVRRFYEKTLIWQVAVYSR